MKKFRAIVSLAICATCLLTAFPVSAATESAPIDSQNTVKTANASVRAYEYKWYYTEIDGKFYKRKYNLTLDRWEGEWVPV